MTPETPAHRAAEENTSRPRLFYFNGGFFTQKQVRRIIELSNYDLKLGAPGPQDLVAVWGKSPTSGRGSKVSDMTGARLVHIEDAFLRSIKPGRDGEPPCGLTIDHQRPYFDSSGPSDLETLLATEPFDDTALLNRARDAIEQLRHLHLSKYNDFDPEAPVPEPGYVLVIDQTRGDASIAHGGGSIAHFREMLVFAQEEHPGARIVIKTHPETAAGHREGHFGPEHLNARMQLLDASVSPYKLFEGAVAVYTVTSGLGFEAILAGHKPVVFGQPFYAGWGLTDDRQPIDRRQRHLTRAQLFAGAMILYPKWYDAYEDRLCQIEDVLTGLAARARAYREDKLGYDAVNMRLWKRAPLREFFGKDVRFRKSSTGTRPRLSWASKMEEAAEAIRVEDGFLRSRGLGADLIAPLSLVTDPVGIYYDARHPSRLEHLIAESPALPDAALRRAENLCAQILRAGVSKYNLPGEKVTFDAQAREVILVPGQVEDDASIRFGTRAVSTNAALLNAVRKDFPDAFIVFKPHPDVEAGLRMGGQIGAEADLIANKSDPISLLSQVHRVTTMTSLLGFEALLRDLPVTCYGAPFYAGWGLTDDRDTIPDRRCTPVTKEQLIYASLIAYPRYFDPVTRQAAPPEVIVRRLSDPNLPGPGPLNRVVAKLQGAFASYAYLWRR